MSPLRRDELALRAVSVLVVGSIAVGLAGLTWRLSGLDDGRKEVATAQSLPPVGAGNAGPDGDVARILALAPFGGGAVSTPGGLPASSLGLVLKGVLMAYPPAASTALIAVGEGPAAIYGIGQSPVPTAVIESIGMDHVVLVVGDGRERLDFPQTSAAAAGGNSATPSATAAPAPVAAAPATLSPQAQAALASASPIASAAAARAQVQTSLPQTPAAPPPNVGQTIAALGASASAQGYRIGTNPSAELRRFGLQPGDLIESVNGRPVGDAASDQQLFETARSAGAARIVIVRGGRRLTLNFPLR